MTKTVSPSTENTKTLNLVATKEGELPALIAAAYANPSFNAAQLQLECNPKSSLDLMACAEEIKIQCKKVKDGDLRRIEDMLVAQSHSLQTIFTKYSIRMANAEYLNQLKAYGTIALRAQNQCRQTLATLAEIKNPKRATFIKNQATNQQINFDNNQNKSKNNSPILSNELLSEGTDAPMDTSGAPAASTANPQMATLEARRG